MRRCLLLLCILAWALSAGEAPTSFLFEETIAGKPSPTTDRSAIEALAAHHRERLARARAELPGALPSVARLIRADIGSLEAELERLAVVGGGTITVGRRLYTVTEGRITVDAEGTRIDVDRATGRGSSSSGAGGDPVTVEMAQPPTPIAATKGTPGPKVVDRPTLRFEISADGRDYIVLIDPTLPNPFARLIPIDGEDAPVALELAKLPGMPLDIAHDSGDFVRRLTCVEVR